VDTLADYSITGDTRLDTSGFTKGISSMTVAAGNLISDLVKTAGSKLAGLAQSSVSVGMNFDASMSQVAATMGTTVDQIQSLTDTAKEMGSTTKFTATQAADALNYLALAGYDANKAAEVLPSVLNLAAAGGMDLAYASDLVTDAMASLNIEANKQNVDEFGNKLAMAASKANANVSQLGEAILTVGGTAANLKGGTTELTTALGLLANVGIKGAEGGTHLRNIILSLQSPTKDAREVMEQLGLEVYDAQGNMRQLDDILTDLNSVMDGMTQGDKDSIINALFNKTDLAAVNGLLAAQGEQWETLASQIDAADGAMGQMAETQQDNLQGVMTSMGSAFEGLQLAVFERLEPALTEAGNYGIQCIRTLSTALSEGGPEAMLQAAGSILTDLAAGVAEQLPGLMNTGVQILTQLAEGIVAATPAMLATAAEVLGALVQGLGEALPQLVATGAQMISQLGEGLRTGLPMFLAQALPLVADFASGLRENIGLLVDVGISLILNLAQGLADGLPTLIEQLPGIISDIAGIINDNAPKLLAAGIQLMAALLKGLVQSIPTLVVNIPQICKAIFDVFTAFRWLDIGKHIVDGLWNGIKSGWTAMLNKVKGLVDLLPKAVKAILGIHSPSKVFAEIGLNVCQGLANGITENAGLAEDAAQQMAGSVAKTAKETVADTLDGLWTQLQEQANTGALGTVGSLYKAVKQQDWAGVGKWAAAALYRGLNADQKQQLQSFGLGLINQLNTTLQGAESKLASAAWSIGTNIYKGITSGFPEVLSRTKDLCSTIKGVFAALKGPLSTLAASISSGLSTGLLSQIPTILGAMGGLIASIGGAFTAMLESIGATLTACGIPTGPLMVAAGVALVATIAAIVASLAGGSHGGGSHGGSGDSSGSAGGITGDVDVSADKLEEAILANTKALEKTNAALADMVRQANGLVLSDTRYTASTVAANGTAQIAAAANNYHREGDTTIIQNINSKAQTAADLMREARWEADTAKSQQR
jgi:TP901 family phage tail tape measure protein